jgi:hypothetical protein
MLKTYCRISGRIKWPRGPYFGELWFKCELNVSKWKYINEVQRVLTMVRYNL